MDVVEHLTQLSTDQTDVAENLDYGVGGSCLSMTTRPADSVLLKRSLHGHTDHDEVGKTRSAIDVAYIREPKGTLCELFILSGFLSLVLVFGRPDPVTGLVAE